MDDFSDTEQDVETDIGRDETSRVEHDNRETNDGEPGEIVSSDEEEVSGRRYVVPERNRDNDKRRYDSRSTKDMSKYQHLKDDPEFNDFLDAMLEKLARSGNNKDLQRDRSTSAKRNDKTNTRKKGNECSKSKHNNLVKSPSDTTLYAPGLRKINPSPNHDNHDGFLRNFTRQSDKQNVETSMIDKISRFVDNIRITSERNNTGRQRSPVRAPPGSGDVRVIEENNGPSTSSSASRRTGTGQSGPNDGFEADTDQTTDQLLLQAEKFRARVEAPKGKSLSRNQSLLMPYDYERLKSRFVTDQGLLPIDNEILFLRNFDQDDEFFHITSQIEVGLKSKIEKGEFVDLERLLPRDKFSSGVRGNDDLNKQLFQLISQGTNSYLSAPEHRNGPKINNIKKWDQAFRVYAAIYTQANPTRSSEIWQYVYIIHTAAAANPWDNVAYYDIVFRELMATKPWRNWGKTYTQGWNMAFNNVSNFVSHSSVHGQSSYTNNNYTGNHNKNNNNWKDSCCRRYNNKNGSGCKRSSNECRYDHRCTFCAQWNHSYANCRKRLGKGNQNNQGGNYMKQNNWSSNKASPAKVENTNNNAKK